MPGAVGSAFKWVAHAVGDVVGAVTKPLVRALTPKVPELNTSSALDFQANPDAGVPYAIGITGTAGTYVYATVGEAKNRNILFNTILSGGGPIDGIVGFSAEGTDVVFDGPDTPNSGPYRHLMWMRTQLGNTPSAALLPPNTLDAGILAEWTPAHKQSGYAVAWLVCGADQKVYSTGVPKPIWKIRGVKVYDWRLDSTYPGGSGPQRINDPATWAFSENPAVHAVAWCLGRYQNGRRVLGLGCFLSQLEMAKFNEWANVCDANGWKVGGIVYSTDTKWQILKAICQAGGAYPIPLGAKISVIFNAPRVSIATLTGADIDGNPSIVGAQLRRDRFNRAVPRYRSEANGWQIVPAAALEIAEFVAQDNNIPHSKELEWPLVQDVDQATQLAAYGICNSREIGPIDLPLIPTWMGLEPGDCITVNEPEFGLTNQKMVIAGRSRTLSTAERSISCVTETDSKHGFCLGLTGTPPPQPSLSAVDTLPAAPDEGSWVVTSGVLAGPGGSLPALILTGAVDDPNAIAIIIEYREILGGGLFGDWVSTERPITARRIEIGGVKAGANYQVRVRYRYARNTENPDDNADLGNVVVGGVNAGELVGRDGAEIVNDVDLSKLAIAEEILRSGTWRGETDDLLYIDGVPVRTVTIQLGVKVDGHEVFITDLRTVDGDGVGKAVFAINADGHIIGRVDLNDGTTGSTYFVVDEFGVVGTDPAHPYKPFMIDAVLGKIVMTGDVLIDGDLNVINGSIKTRGIEVGAVSGVTATAGDYGGLVGNPGGGADVCSITVTGVGRPILIQGMYQAKMTSGPGNINASAQLNGLASQTPKSGSYAPLNYDFSHTFMAVETLGAGVTRTYTIRDVVGLGGNIAFYSYGLSATVLKV